MHTDSPWHFGELLCRDGDNLKKLTFSGTISCIVTFNICLRGRKIQSGETFFSKKKCNCTIVRHGLEDRLIVVKKNFCNLTPSYGAKQGPFQVQL